MFQTKTNQMVIPALLGFCLAFPLAATAGAMKKLAGCEKAATIRYIQDLDERIEDLESRANFLVSKTNAQNCAPARDGLKDLQANAKDVFSRIKKAQTPMSYLESNGDKYTDSKPCTENLKKVGQAVQDLYQKSEAAVAQKCSSNGWANPAGCNYANGNSCK